MEILTSQESEAAGVSVKRVVDWERTVCGMWHHRMIRLGKASDQWGTNRPRNVASQDDLPGGSSSDWERAACEMWYHRMTRTRGASDRPRKARVRNVASQDDPSRRIKRRTVCRMWHRKTIRPCG